MEQHGFIQDMLDVKVLILFVMAKLSYPVSLQKIYELCYQDDKLSYFDVSVAVPQMVQSGHLEQLPDETYRITDKGREHEEITCDAIAYPVMQRAKAAVERFNKIMTGRARAVSTRNLMALARFFGCSMQELIDAFSGKTE